MHPIQKIAAAAVMAAAVGAISLAGARPASADVNPIIILKFPDVKVESTSFVETSTSVYMKVVVKNGGAGNAGAFNVTVRDGYTNALLQMFPVNGLASGATTTLWHKLPGFSCGGTHFRKILADSGNAVLELNENNNTAQNTYIYPVC